MPISRYRNENGVLIDISNDIYKLANSGQIDVKYILSEERKRLDYYAHEQYGNGMYWWVIAAASGIGWWLQCPPGTLLIIPEDISQIQRLLQ